LIKDPLVSVVTSVTSGPGATVQGWIGNVQSAFTASAVSELRTALTQFIQSQEVQTLAPEDKQSLLDVAEVVSSEIDKATPDGSKLARWGRRLLEIAERLGVAVAATGVSHVLFGPH